jgi:cytoskeletal protein RodZ
MSKITQNNSTDSIEKFLRSARKSQGISLDNVANDTKIRKIYLKQFETSVPDKLDVYQIGYLRLYARYLGVDIQAEALKQLNNNTGKNSASLSSIMRRGLNVPRTLLIALALMLALASLVIAQWKKRGLPPEPSTVQDSSGLQVNESVASQTDRYTHLLTDYSGKVKVIANIATVFALVDPVSNATIARGTLKSGEELILPNAKSIIVKTTIPDALDFQQ